MPFLMKKRAVFIKAQTEIYTSKNAKGRVSMPW